MYCRQWCSRRHYGPGRPSISDRGSPVLWKPSSAGKEVSTLEAISVHVETWIAHKMRDWYPNDQDIHTWKTVKLQPETEWIISMSNYGISPYEEQQITKEKFREFERCKANLSLTTELTWHNLRLQRQSDADLDGASRPISLHESDFTELETDGKTIYSDDTSMIIEAVKAHRAWIKTFADHPLNEGEIDEWADEIEPEDPSAKPPPKQRRKYRALSFETTDDKDNPPV